MCASHALRMIPTHYLYPSMEVAADQAKAKAKAKARQTAFRCSDLELLAQIDAVSRDVLALEQLAVSRLNGLESLSSLIILSKELLDTLTHVWDERPKQKRSKAA